MRKIRFILSMTIIGFAVTLSSQGCGTRFQAIEQSTTSLPSLSTTISAAAWAALAKLSPSTVLPAPPADLSNQYADNQNAAALGQQIFFDPGFSGVLLESDNDGFHGGVGRQGDSKKVSCASCHLPASGFSDTRTLHKQLSLAAGWTLRRTPSLLDVGHAKLLMWDGRFDSLQRQVLAVFESPLEGNSSRLFFAQEIARRYAPPYQAIFGTDPTVVLGASYPKPLVTQTGCQMALSSLTTPTEECTGGTRSGMPGTADYDALTETQKREVITIVMNVGKAVAAYERKLSCGSSRFDEFMHGDSDALTLSEQRGAALFVGKAKCVTCHSGPFFSDQKFYNVGLVPATVSAAFIRKNDRGAEKGLAQVIADPLNIKSAFSDGDDGRSPASVGTKMLGAFRTPMLRCSSRRPSFMHTGQLRTLESVVKYFNDGGHKQLGVPLDASLGYLGETEITPLGLNDEESTDLVNFLKALDGAGPSAELLEEPGVPTLPTPTPTPAAGGKVALVGDSITYGYEVPAAQNYPSKLQQLLGSNFEVQNFGRNGAGVLKQGTYPYWGIDLFTASTNFRPNIVVIMLGTNDSKPTDWTVRSSQFENDYVDLVRHYQGLGATVYVAISPPAVSSPEYWQIDQVIPHIENVIRTTGARRIDVNQALSNSPQLFMDAVHPTAAGYTVLAQTVYNALR